MWLSKPLPSLPDTIPWSCFFCLWVPSEDRPIGSSNTVKRNQLVHFILLLRPPSVSTTYNWALFVWRLKISSQLYAHEKLTAKRISVQNKEFSCFAGPWKISQYLNKAKKITKTTLKNNLVHFLFMLKKNPFHRSYLSFHSCIGFPSGSASALFPTAQGCSHEFGPRDPRRLWSQKPLWCGTRLTSWEPRVLRGIPAADTRRLRSPWRHRQRSVSLP